MDVHITTKSFVQFGRDIGCPHRNIDVKWRDSFLIATWHRPAAQWTPLVILQVGKINA
jgi:hypothetical protein